MTQLAMNWNVAYFAVQTVDSIPNILNFKILELGNEHHE